MQEDTEGKPDASYQARIQFRGPDDAEPPKLADLNSVIEIALAQAFPEFTASVTSERLDR